MFFCKKQGRIAQSAQELKQTRSIAGTALLTAVSTVLRALTLSITEVLKIGFSFLGVALCGYWYGPIMSALCGGMMDVLGFILHPTGPYFFGFTFNEMVAGFIYGCWLYKEEPKLWRCVCACATAMLVVNLFLTPMWLQLLYGNTILLSSARLIKNLVQLPFNVALLYTLLKVAKRTGIVR